jgi:hypothetical protein
MNFVLPTVRNGIHEIHPMTPRNSHFTKDCEIFIHTIEWEYCETARFQGTVREKWVSPKNMVNALFHILYPVLGTRYITLCIRTRYLHSIVCVTKIIR